VWFVKKVFKWIGLSAFILVLGGVAVVLWNLYLKPFNLRILADRQAIDFVRDQPELLTSIGAIDGTPLDSHSDELSDVSVAARDRGYAQAQKYLDEVNAYAKDDSYKGQDRWTVAVLRDSYQSSLAYKAFEWSSEAGTPYAIDQMNGSHTGIADFMINQHQVTNKRSADHYLARLKAIPTKLGQLDSEVRRQADAGVILPTFLFDKVLNGISELTKPAPEQNQLIVSFKEKLSKVTELTAEQQAQMVTEATQTLTNDIYPAYVKLSATMTQVRGKATSDAGVWKLPNGEAFYAQMVRENTTTDMTPDQIHQIGLAEVARIEAKMKVILDKQKVGGPTIGARIDAISARADQQFSNDDAGRKAIIDEYNRILTQMKTQFVPRYFSVTPPQALEVKRVPSFQEGGAAGAYYQQPAMDGSRPGVFYANLKDVSATPRLGMKTLAYHEGIPGHHFQIALSMNLSSLPLLRQMGIYTAYVEGWALYSENLAKEMGVYKDDDLGDLGRLQAEMFRAVRLVVDTGIHSKRWTREQSITFMREKTGMAASEVEGEIDRYCVMPGQALAYKVGMLKIQEVRARAMAALGTKFDIKAFHAVILENGALPLGVLDKVVDEWIEQRKG
jgi:uncharacterized protein (DUF885 family)